jgi:predicted transcriptional regulator
MQGQNSELQSELCELQEKNKDLEEGSRVMLEQNRGLKELVHRMENETDVRLSDRSNIAWYI